MAEGVSLLVEGMVIPELLRARACLSTRRPSRRDDQVPRPAAYLQRAGQDYRWSCGRIFDQLGQAIEMLQRQILSERAVLQCPSSQAVRQGQRRK